MDWEYCYTVTSTQGMLNLQNVSIRFAAIASDLNLHECRRCIDGSGSKSILKMQRKI
jgi:hypothetical protein